MCNYINKINFKKSKGFSILTVILAIAVFTVLISSWAFSGPINNLTLSLDIQAENIINDGRNIKLSYDNLIISGVSPVNIQFIPNSTNSFNMLNPVTGITWPKVNPASLKTGLNAPFGMWVYNPNKLIGNNIGTSSPDPAVLIQGITDPICKKINYNLHGSEYVPSFGFNGSVAILVANASVSYPVTNITNAQYLLNGMSGWMNGCINGSSLVDGPNNFYYQILKPI